MSINVLVLTQQYPKETNLYRNGFVHTRIKSYKEFSDELVFTVFVVNKRKKILRYEFENVRVIEGNQIILREYLQQEKVDRIVVHFLMTRMIHTLLTYAQEIPKLVWVHGYETLSWKTRTFNKVTSDFPKFVLSNYIQMYHFRSFVKKNQNTTFIFVSHWMKQMSERDAKVSYSDYLILPNGIDTELFSYKENKEEMRYKVLMIRPFNSRKYATDLACKAIEKLAEHPHFEKYSFTIIGEGEFFDLDTNSIHKYSNVTCINRFLTSKEIKEYHDEHGIFLCPTRQDAQGVSMCEAMSSGLVPVTSNSTAIPEFVENGQDGFLCNDVSGLTEALIQLAENKDMFKKMSRNAREKIVKKCNLIDISNEEYSLIKNGSK